MRVPPLVASVNTLGMTRGRSFHNLALIGFMGVGKTTVGRILARQLHFQFVDTDDLIETTTQLSISKIFAEKGEPAFRQLEYDALAELSRHRDTVIATGGGLGAVAANLESLKQHALVVCLWATPDGIWQRVHTQSHRPLLQTPDPQARIRELLAERGPIYRQADVLVNTHLRSVREVAQHVLHQFQLARRSQPSPPAPHPPGV